MTIGDIKRDSMRKISDQKLVEFVLRINSSFEPIKANRKLYRQLSEIMSTLLPPVVLCLHLHLNFLERKPIPLNHIVNDIETTIHQRLFLLLIYQILWAPFDANCHTAQKTETKKAVKLSLNCFLANLLTKDYWYFFITKVALVPPNPKLFDMTVLISASRASVTMSNPCACSSSSLTLIDGATNLFSIINNA